MVRGLTAIVSVASVLLGAASAWSAAYAPGWTEQEIARYPTSRTGGLAIGADGRIVLGGAAWGYPRPQAWVRRYLPDGRPDPGFGDAGKADLDPSTGPPRDIGVQSSGRVVVLAGDPTHTTLLQRLNADGTPDPTFGIGGTAEVGFGPTAVQLVVLGDDRLVLLDRQEGRLTLTGLSQDGGVDRGFGAHGYATIDTGAEASSGHVVEAPYGDLVVTSSGDSARLTIARLTPLGAHDTSFGGGDGIVTLDLAGGRFGAGLAAYPYANLRPLVLSDGRIRVPLSVRRSSTEPRRMALLGLTGTGELDRRFGRGGLAIGPRPARRGGELAHTLVADGRGGILAAGVVSHVDLGYGNDLLRRFHADGTVDRSFKASWIGDEFGGMEMLSSDLLAIAEFGLDDKYQFWGPARLWTVDAGYDTKAPAIAIRFRGCRVVRVEISDRTGVRRVVARTRGRVLRRTSSSRFRLRTPAGARRITIKATDMAGNVSTVTVRLPRC